MAKEKNLIPSFENRLTRHEHGLMHAAESGTYGEALIRLELSRAGWLFVSSCQNVGIDILAVAPSKRRIGISVKCRDRYTRNPNASTFIFREKSGKSTDGEITRFREICHLLGVEPWIAVVTITPEFTYEHLISLQHYVEKYATDSRSKDWKNTKKWLGEYVADTDILGNKQLGVRGVWTL